MGQKSKGPPGATGEPLKHLKEIRMFNLTLIKKPGFFQLKVKIPKGSFLGLLGLVIKHWF
jgi:hypothetical protein